MIIKRFGVPLAASGLVVVLGALGVAQAHRDAQQQDESEQWEPAAPAAEPPAPIAALEDDHTSVAAAPPSRQETNDQDAAQRPSLADLGIAPDSDEPPAGDPAQASLGGVRTVSHEQSADGPPQLDEPPDDQATESPAMAPSGFALPDWADQDSPLSAPPAAVAGSTEQPTAENLDQSPAVPDGDVAGLDVAPSDAAAPPMNELRGGLPTTAADDAAADDAAAMPASSIPAGSFNGNTELIVASSDEDSSITAPFTTVDDAITGVEPQQPAAGPQRPFADQPVETPPAMAGLDRSAGRTDGFAAGEVDPGEDLSGGPAGMTDAGIAAAAQLAPADDQRTLNQPGDRRLEGTQSPSVVIQKRAPEQVKVGKPATFVIQVQNVGGVDAFDVRVADRVPAGMRLIDATPHPQSDGDLLVWQLGALEPGGERTVSLQLVAEEEGELGSVARVSFEAAAAVRTVSTRPRLQVTQRAPEQVLIGQQVEIELEVSNPGSGAATGVVMQTDVPEGLEHPKGRQLDNLIGTLGPGEVRRHVLRLRAVAAGVIENQVRVVAEDDLSAEDIKPIKVIAPELALELEGPSRRFLERQATYQVNLANVGSAEATNIELVAYLDRGFSFVGTEYQGQYDPSRHAVYWSLAELPPEARGVVPLTLLPIQQGERAIRLEARGDLDLVANHEKAVQVDTLAELNFTITDDADPIEVGSEVNYEIRIGNRGSREDTDVELQLQLPAGLELVSSDSDASTDGQGLVVFEPQGVIDAGDEVVHRVRVRGKQAGTHVVRATISSSQSPTPVTKEESTTVYADR